MSDSLSFKAYLKRDGQEVEVRRFGIDSGVATSYMYIRAKIQAMFPSIQNNPFTIFWQDLDKDYITVSSDEELMVALAANTMHPIIKLYIQVKPDQDKGKPSQEIHPGVTCDGCEGEVVGFRYKCVTCADFDLCSNCEASGKHSEHFMLRMSTPISSTFHPKLVRKFLRPHKFHKRHGWNRFAEMYSESQQGPSQCPFSQRENSGSGAAKQPDMFDFSALMEFINSLGVAATGEAEATASAQATSSSQPQATSSQESQQSSAQRQTAPSANVYLTGIGQAIAAFLDPLGVDVTFDVRPKATGTQESATTTTPNPQQATPAPNPQQATPAPNPKQTTPSPNPQQTTPSPNPQPTPSPNPQPTPSPNPQQTTPSPNTQQQTIPASSNQESSARVPQSTTPPFEIIMPISTPIKFPSQSRTARENSPSADGWTFINQDSPIPIHPVAMDVEEIRGARPKTSYPELPKEAPTAPPPSDNGLTDSERGRIQEAVERIHSMGFNFESSVLRELLRRENCDIATVLEMILSNAGKK